MTPLNYQDPYAIRATRKQFWIGVAIVVGGCFLMGALAVLMGHLWSDHDHIVIDLAVAIAMAGLIYARCVDIGYRRGWLAWKAVRR
jgi:peptidoglycan/LPS O-acetylase OafA/YrhL